MTKHTSVAVMARRVEPADSLDFFPTPPWATRALPAHVLPKAWPWPDLFKGTARDPACGQGHMALALDETFARVEAADIHPYGYGAVQDFLHPDHGFDGVDWIITNPPFNRGEEFVLKALRLARRGVAMLVRTQFLEGAGRFRALFARARTRPQLVAQFSERVPMHRGRWVVDGSTATAYCWLVWLKHRPHDWPADPPTIWIPPGCRTALAKHDDWLRFGGCQDLAKTHPAIRLQDDPTRVEASLDDVARELQGRLV